MYKATDYAAPPSGRFVPAIICLFTIAGNIMSSLFFNANQHFSWICMHCGGFKRTRQGGHAFLLCMFDYCLPYKLLKILLCDPEMKRETEVYYRYSDNGTYCKSKSSQDTKYVYVFNILNLL